MFLDSPCHADRKNKHFALCRLKALCLLASNKSSYSVQLILVAYVQEAKGFFLLHIYCISFHLNHKSAFVLCVSFVALTFKNKNKNTARKSWKLVDFTHKRLSTYSKCGMPYFSYPT